MGHRRERYLVAPGRVLALVAVTALVTGCAILGPVQGPSGSVPTGQTQTGQTQTGQTGQSPTEPTPTSTSTVSVPLQPQGAITVATPAVVAGQAYELSNTSQASTSTLAVTLARLADGAETKLASGTANLDGSSIRGVVERGHAFQLAVPSGALKVGDQVVVTVTSSDGQRTTRLGPATVEEVATGTTAAGVTDIAPDLLRSHVAFLASDATKGRASGGGELEGAVTQYIEQVFNQLGVLPGVKSGTFRQPFTIRRYAAVAACRADAGDEAQPETFGRQLNEGGLAFSPSGELATVADARYSVSLEAAGTQTHNLVGLIEGSDPNLKDRYLVVGAHMDHLGTSSRGIYKGADDNGSGTAAVLAIARALIRDKSRGEGPGCNVLLVLFAGEELGLLGSQYFVTNPPVPLSSMVGMINLDMIGRLDPGQVSVFDRTPQGGYNLFHSLHDASGTVLGRVNHDMGRAASGSDHYPFFKKGVPAIFFFEGTQNGKMNPDYHGRGDTAEKIDYNKLADITRFAYKHLLAAASRRVS